MQNIEIHFIFPQLMKEALGHDNEKEVEQNRSENSRGNEGDNESDEQWISVSQEDEDVGFPPEPDDGGSTPDEKVKKGIKLFSCEVLNVCLLTANQIKLIPTGSTCPLRFCKKE